MAGSGGLGGCLLICSRRPVPKSWALCSRACPAATVARGRDWTVDGAATRAIARVIVARMLIFCCGEEVLGMFVLAC